MQQAKCNEKETKEQIADTDQHIKAGFLATFNRINDFDTFKGHR